MLLGWHCGTTQRHTVSPVPTPLSDRPAESNKLGSHLEFVCCQPSLLQPGGQLRLAAGQFNCWCTLQPVVLPALVVVREARSVVSTQSVTEWSDGCERVNVRVDNCSCAPHCVHPLTLQTVTAGNSCKALACGVDAARCGTTALVTAVLGCVRSGVGWRAP